VFRSFFPSPVNFFTSAIAWTAVAMTIWFTAGGYLEPYLSVGRWIAIQPTEAIPDPFFNTDRVWLYQFVLMAGYGFCIPWYFLNDNRRWYWWSVVGTVTIIEVVSSRPTSSSS
jgi:peptide/bleomycin uptake transporter